MIKIIFVLVNKTAINKQKVYTCTQNHILGEIILKIWCKFKSTTHQQLIIGYEKYNKKYTL